MSRMSRSRKFAGVLLAAATVLGLADVMVVPSARAALPDLTSNKFSVLNYGSYDIRHSGLVDDDRIIVTQPQNGHTLGPGVEGAWELKKNIKRHTAELRFADADPASPASYKRNISIRLTTSDTSSNNRVHVSCEGIGFICQIRGNSIAILDDTEAFPEVAERSVANPQQQYELLKNLCTADSADSCVFTVTSREIRFGDAERVTEAYYSGAGMTYSEQQAFETTATSSVSTTVAVDAAFKALQGAVRATYSTEISHTRTEVETLTFRVGPELWFWIELQPAVTRYEGNFTLKSGRSNITLRDVHYDIPDKTRTSILTTKTSSSNPLWSDNSKMSKFNGIEKR